MYSEFMMHGKKDIKLHGKFEICCWRMLEDISWTDHVRNAEVLHRVEWGINIVKNRQEKTRKKT